MTVIDFPGETRLDLDPKRILETALEQDFECVLVVGWKNDGDLMGLGKMRTQSAQPRAKIFP